MVKEKYLQLTTTKILNEIILILLSTLLIYFGPSDPTVYKGNATYYGQHWTGKLTASGERFYADSLTAAHKYFKFGTILKVTNLNNASVCYVKVNDRLPKSSSILIDLCYGTAKQLNFFKKRCH
jgi:rare lipoprotein A